jgi:hypothetical protein
MADLSRRAFFTRGLPGSVAVLLGGGIAAPAPAAAAQRRTRPGPGDISARDLRRSSRAEVREALRRIRARARAR